MKIKIPNTMAAPNINDRQKALILNEIYMRKFRGRDLPDRRGKVFSRIFNRHALIAFQNFFNEREVKDFPEAVECLDQIVDEVVDYFHSDIFEQRRVKMFAEEHARVKEHERSSALVSDIRRKLDRDAKKLRGKLY